MERMAGSEKFPLGSLLPSFSLKGVDGEMVDSQAYSAGAKATLVVFACNHCPYVKGAEDELIQVVKRFSAEGLRTMVINSNDAVQYPDDSFDNMKLKAAKLAIPYPYLFDESQQVAKSFDAACTPECYLFDGEKKLVYHGAINDSHRDASAVTKHYLADTIQAVLRGNSPEQGFVRAIGCSIKWAA